MHILHLTNKPIFPLVDGGCVAMFRFAELLDEPENTIKSLSISTDKHPFNPTDYPSGFYKRFQPEAGYINTNIRYSGAIKHLFSGRSYNLSRFRSSDFAQRLSDLLQTEQPDLIICESLYVLPYLPEIRKASKARVLVRTHNIEFAIWESLSKENSFPKSWYLGKLAKSLKREELNLLNQVDGILAISQQDADGFRQMGITVPVQVIPVTIPLSKKSDNLSPDFHHIGSMNWQPNMEAVQYLISQLFPAIRRELPNAQLHLAGSFFPEHIRSNPEQGIIVHGFVEDAGHFVREYGTQLVPLKSGSGVRIKLLESLASGIPVVTTPVGASGLPDVVSECIRIAPDDSTFVKDAVELAKNPDLRATLGKQAQKFIQSYYSQEAVKKTLFEFINSIS